MILFGSKQLHYKCIYVPSMVIFLQIAEKQRAVLKTCVERKKIIIKQSFSKDLILYILVRDSNDSVLTDITYVFPLEFRFGTFKQSFASKDAALFLFAACNDSANIFLP